MSWLLLLPALYLLLALALYLYQDRLLYPGGRERPPLESYEYIEGSQRLSEVSLLHSGNVELVHWFAPPRDPAKPIVVSFHGNAGHTGDRLEKLVWLLEQGYGLFMVEYRGYGGMPGRASEAVFRDDALTVLDWLEEQGYPAGRLVTYGESLGTGLATWVAAQFPVQAVVLEAPYDSILSLGMRRYGFFPVKWLLRDHWRSDVWAADVTAPVLILHGSRDRIIPIEHSRHLFEAFAGPKQMEVFEEGQHIDLYDHGAEAVATKFLNTHLKAFAG
ncbi:alpha/beta hydrolase [Kiloniella sp. b19]|uniref:alpha/beta hydrolase n=1 Tax=Kiloniella sp. GXU_MW_B19 TaxID=3141326 RepID=UPI0031D03785